MEIEVGEYVRNESGYIYKINSFDKLTNFYVDEENKLKEWVGEDVFGNEIAETIVKHSKNIIDLIEVGDYVNGHLVTKIEDGMITEISNWFGIDWKKEDIKSIVTKEMMKSIEYKIE